MNRERQAEFSPVTRNPCSAPPNYPRGRNYQCIAVSASADPLGAYYRYAYAITKLNDYPKFVAGASHAGDLDGTTSAQGNNWSANVRITVHDGTHAPVPNATVTGAWSGGTSGSASCTTDTTGQCSVNKGGLKRGQTAVTFTVTNISAAGLAYASESNHDSDGDSNGTAITLNRPQ